MLSLGINLFGKEVYMDTDDEIIAEMSSVYLHDIVSEVYSTKTDDYYRAKARATLGLPEKVLT